MSLLPRKIHNAWNEFLTEDILTMLSTIENSIGQEYSPDNDKILRFLETDLPSLKIVILGQDPYPEKGKATGRAFEVGGLDSWDQPFRQVSLKNIVRLIYKNQKGIEEYECIPKFSEIINEIKRGNFSLAAPADFFNKLESQGVLFLNTCFTVYPGKPLSHINIWQPFTRSLIFWLSTKKPELIWFLWGKNALAYKPFIKNGKFYESRHPMMCSDTYSDDFLKCQCIAETMKIVNWTGK